jgi:hypothetical protein
LRSSRAFSISGGRSRDLLADQRATAVANRTASASPSTRYRRIGRDMISTRVWVSVTALGRSAGPRATRIAQYRTSGGSVTSTHVDRQASFGQAHSADYSNGKLPVDALPESVGWFRRGLWMVLALMMQVAGPGYRDTRRPAFACREWRLRAVAHRRRYEVRPFGCRLPKLAAVIRQWPLPPSSAFLDECSKRRLTKYIGHWNRKSPVAGVGHTATFDDQTARVQT